MPTLTRVSATPELTRLEVAPPTVAPRRPDHPLTVLRQLVRNRLGLLGLIIVGSLVFVALAADLLAPYSPAEQAYTSVLAPPSSQHLLGTDELGRDILSRLIFGARVSLQVGLIAVSLATGLGVAIGLAAGYFGGWVDELLMRVIDAVYSFPALLLALAITAALGPGITNAMIAVGVVYLPPFARLVRGQVLSVREQDFVTAARVSGASDLRLMVLHIWPNVTSPIVVQASLSVSFAIITEAALSFLGVGVQPPTPSWGSMLRTGYQYLEQAWWFSFFPGLAIFVTVLGLNFLGDGLRMVLDPKLRARGEA